MTIDEAIKELKNFSYLTNSEELQIAEWLEELKWYEQGMEDIPSESGVLPKDVYHAGYNKAIDDFAEKLKEMANNSSTKYIRLSEKETITTYGVEQIAEQLKRGAENEQSI